MSTEKPYAGPEPSERELQVLIVDDEADVAEMTADFLEHNHDRISTVTETGARDGLARLAEADIDCVVSDYQMSETDGLEFLESVRRKSPETPFILFTGQGSEEIASEAISAGVTDYLQKGGGSEQYELLANRIANAVENARTREALAEQEAWSRGLIEASVDILAVLDPDGTFQYASPATADILSYEPDTLVGQNAFDRIHPADTESVAEHFGKLHTDPADAEVAEFRYRQADGDWVWLEAQGINRLDDSVIEGIVVNVRDISQRKAREQDLERYRTIVDAVGDGIYTLDAEGFFTTVNDHVVEQTGYERDDLVGSHVSTVLTDESIETGAILIEELLTDPDREVVTYEATVEPADDESFPIELRLALLPTEEETFRGTVGIARPITERKQGELLLQNEQLREFETLVETVPNGVFELDAEGTMRHVNDEWARMLGMERTALEGLSFESLVDEGILPEHIIDQYLDLLRELLSSTSDRTMGTITPEIVPPDDTEAHIYEAHIALLPNDEEFQGSAVVVRDITDKEQQRAHLERQTERLEEFASALSHDLRSPLNVAQGRLEYGMRTGDRAHLETASDALDRMEDLIESLLELARHGDLINDRTAIDVDRVVEAATTTVDLRSAEMEIGDLPTVQGDEERLRTLFENLLQNAVEHGGADVTITVGALDNRNGFYIADDGPGIPADVRDRVTVRGVSTRDAGTGFGLSIVRQIVEAHDWEFTVTESATGGTRIEISGVETTEPTERTEYPDE